MPVELYDAGSSDDAGAVNEGPMDAGLPDAGEPDAGVSDAGTVDAGPGFLFPFPIQHVIVIVKENHTFDNYFGTFPGAEGTTTYQLSDGGSGVCGHAPDRTPRDMSHEHASGLTDWNDGGMNGWDLEPTSSVNGDKLAFAQYAEADIPNYWQYARSFTLADHFFSEMIGPSFPGHLAALAAQAGWAVGNPSTGPLNMYWGCDEPAQDSIQILSGGTCVPQAVHPCFNIPSVPDVLPAGLDWKYYGSNFYVFHEVWSLFDAVSSIRNGPEWANVVTYDQFDKDIDNNRLPAVSWLVDQDLADEHPGIGSVCAGENWTVQKINKLMSSSYWSSTAILFTMDDFGGWYDHVPPPRQYGCDAAHPYGLGFRLPLIIISPYAKQGFILKEVAEHASIPRFIETMFGAPPLSTLDPAAQDGQANDLLNAFDFTQAPLPKLVLQTRTCPP
jgi:phospholipase C